MKPPGAVAAQAALTKQGIMNRDDNKSSLKMGKSAGRVNFMGTSLMKTEKADSMISGLGTGGDRDLNIEVFVMRQLTRISERGRTAL